MRAAIPELRAAQRWNIVWVIPILALLISAWMIYRSLSSQGAVALVRLETADGIAAGKTEVRCRSVLVGLVKDVKLAENLKSVVISLEMKPDLGGLLRTGTKFWVVRPRVSTTDISGLGTLITGAYIELDPGSAEGEEVNHFNGLETPPATNGSIPGLRLKFTAEQAGSLVAGSPIYYRGFEVGRIESRVLDLEHQGVIYDAFIQEKYSSLVKNNSRFWNTSGIDISAGADGFKVRTPSFQAMLSGGATFGVDDGVLPGKPAANGAVFTLFANEDAANSSAFNPTMKFVLLFEQSVRGLAKAAPVEFRGIPIGRVANISFDYLRSADDANDSRVPVLVELDPSLLRREVVEKMNQVDNKFLNEAVGRGLRATLKTGSLLTGALFVDLDYYKDSLPATLGQVGDFPSIPTISSGFAQLEAKLTAFFNKIQSLPLNETLDKVGKLADEATITAAASRTAVEEFNRTMISVRKTLDSKEFTQLPEDLRGTLAALSKSVSSLGPDGAVQGDLLRTLDELRAALRSINGLASTIDQKPSSLLFGRDSSGNLVPKAPKSSR